MASNRLLEIWEQGQSIWMDNLTRDLIQSGELKRMVEQDGIRGITSNPSIFEKAIANNVIYNADIEAGIRAKKTVEEIYESLIFEDIRNACDILRPVYDESGGLDGYVSIEVRPTISDDETATIEEARRYYQQIGKENVMIKIPGTLSGFGAIQQAIQEGINVNVTLLFSIENYLQAAEAYLRGLEARVRQNQDISKLSSVASFFLSRIDVHVDQQIEEKLKTVSAEDTTLQSELKAAMGKVAIANAKIAYQKYKELIQSDRWQTLAKKGANPQRLLWASTGTKNPQYSDVMYVDSLIGAETVNTLPPATLKACADHCDVADRLETDLEQAYQLIEKIKEPYFDIHLDQVMEDVLQDGIAKFIEPYQSLISSLEEKVEQLVPIAG
jgi:transaldolase